MKKYEYHKDGTTPRGDEIFVFGSNLAGIHGAGAAKAAAMFFAAEMGQGVGHVGQSYAIPTKDERIESRSVTDISKAIDDFIDFANDNPDMNFWITRCGCGLAGFKDSQIAPLFVGCPNTCNFPEEWSYYLEDE